MSRADEALTLSDFLRQLRQRMPSPPEPTPLPTEPATTLSEVSAADDLPARFASEAEAIGCHVHRVTDANWAETIREIAGNLSARSILVEAQPETALTNERAATLQTMLAEGNVAAVTDDEDATLFSVDAAVTGVVSAVAETGTVVCCSGPSSARGASLVPPVHIALVAESQLVPDLFDLFGQLRSQKHLPANINLITGPSKTADIEGVLVTGVHGPGTVHIVLMSGC